MSPTPNELRDIAQIIRRDVLTMTLEAGSGHIGGSLSAVDLLTVLYWERMRVNPERPRWEDRDRFVLSKAHASPALYAALARRGYFDVRELMTFRKLKSMLQGFPDMQRTPGIDASVGSPGQGLSIANGLAMAAKRDGKTFRVYCLMGDGEAHEGLRRRQVIIFEIFKLLNFTNISDQMCPKDFYVFIFPKNSFRLKIIMLFVKLKVFISKIDIIIFTKFSFQ